MFKAIKDLCDQLRAADAETRKRVFILVPTAVLIMLATAFYVLKHNSQAGSSSTEDNTEEVSQ